MKKDIYHLFQEFIFECEFIRRIKPDTLRGYTQCFKTLQRLIPDISLDSLSPHSIAQFFKLLQERQRIVGKGMQKVGVKSSTIINYCSKLNNFCEWLVLRKYLKSNPFRTIVYPSPVPVYYAYLKKEDIEKIVTAIYIHCDNNLFIQKRSLVLFYMALFCGLRRGELLSLQIRDIDFERKTLTVRGQTSKSKRTRQIPLHSSVFLAVKDYLNQRKEYTTPYLFASKRDDNKLSLDGLKHVIEKLRQWSGIHFHLHQFRHTFAVNFLKTSNNIVKLQLLLGHQDIRMTMPYVASLPTDEMRGDIEALSIDNLI